MKVSCEAARSACQGLQERLKSFLSLRRRGPRSGRRCPVGRCGRKGRVRPSSLPAAPRVGHSRVPAPLAWPVRSRPPAGYPERSVPARAARIQIPDLTGAEGSPECLPGRQRRARPLVAGPRLALGGCDARGAASGASPGAGWKKEKVGEGWSGRSERPGSKAVLTILAGPGRTVDTRVRSP